MYKNVVNRLRSSFVSINRAVDSYESQNYSINQYGHIRNDFAQLSEEQDSLDYSRLLARMQEMSFTDDGKDKSFDELVSTLRPRWCQTPAEMDRFEQYMISNAIDYYKTLKENETESFAEADVDKTSSETQTA